MGERGFISDLPNSDEMGYTGVSHQKPDNGWTGSVGDWIALLGIMFFVVALCVNFVMSLAWNVSFFSFEVNRRLWALAMYYGHYLLSLL